MLKAFINGKDTCHIAFKDDHEPVQIYANGELVENISYIPQDVTGESSAQYKSEYKKNLRALQIEGNTEQSDITYEGYNIYDIDAITGASGWNAEDVSPNTDLNTITDGVMHLKFGLYGIGQLFPIKWNGATIPIKQGGDYYVSCDVLVESGAVNTQIVCSLVNMTTTEYLPLTYSTNLEKDTWTRYIFSAISVPDDWVGNEVYLILQAVGSSTETTNIPIYAKNVMVTYNNNTDVYEPYVGGMAYPSIKYPSAISNSGTTGLAAILKGINLFDIDNPFFAVENSFNVKYSPKIENGIIYSGGKYGASDGAYLCIKTDGESKYTFTYNVNYNAETETTRVHRFGLFSDVDENGLASESYLLNRAANITSGKHTYTIDCQGYEYVGITWYSNTQYGIEITDLQIQKGAEATACEPYIEPTSVQIPAYIALESGANDVWLELAGLGTYADKLVIDRTKGSVKYIQQIGVVRPFVGVGGTLSYATRATNHDVWKFTLNRQGLYDAQSLVKCEFGKVFDDNSTSSYIGKDIFGVYLINKDYFYIYIPASLGITSVEALDSYLMQSQTYGVSIEYVLETPVEWNMATIDETLSNSLLEWAKATQNQTNIIEITSTPSVSNLSVNYAKWGGG